MFWRVTSLKRHGRNVPFHYCTVNFCLACLVLCERLISPVINPARRVGSPIPISRCLWQLMYRLHSSSYHLSFSFHSDEMNELIQHKYCWNRRMYGRWGCQGMQCISLSEDILAVSVSFWNFKFFKDLQGKRTICIFKCCVLEGHPLIGGLVVLWLPWSRMMNIHDVFATILPVMQN